MKKWQRLTLEASVTLGVAAAVVVGPVTPLAQANPGGGGCGGSLDIQATPDSFNLGLAGGCGSFGGGGYDPGPNYVVNRPGPGPRHDDCWNCGGPAMIWKGGPVPGAPAVLVESWKIDWEWCWRDGDQGLNWYLDPPRW